MEALVVKLELPWPPSLNHYYRHVGPRVLISKKGRDYREAVAAKLASEDILRMHGKIALSLDAYPPDNRRRDVDNLLKCLLDSLTGCLVDDDSQIKRLTVTMREPMHGTGGLIYLEAKPFTLR